METDIFVFVAEMYCKMEYFSGICAQNGYLMPKNITRPYEIKVKATISFVLFVTFFILILFCSQPFDRTALAKKKHVSL